MAEYETIALSLAHDRQRLAAVTTLLRTAGRAAPLFDMASYTANFERAMLGVWDAWRHRAGGNAARREG
jgi:predicted O-linked N-acetylglucosamine transferase (SPINDLY family)